MYLVDTSLTDIQILYLLQRRLQTRIRNKVYEKVLKETSTCIRNDVNDNVWMLADKSEDIDSIRNYVQ